MNRAKGGNFDRGWAIVQEDIRRFSASVVRFKVKLNGTALGDDHGSDSSADGAGEVREPRMYQLVRQKGSVKDAVFEIEFLDPGVEVFSFTFG